MQMFPRPDFGNQPLSVEERLSNFLDAKNDPGSELGGKDSDTQQTLS
jgi:hypothetical protein